jgi:hypothetical protein
MVTQTTTNIPTTGTTDSAVVSSLPDWYNQYAQSIAGAGLGVLNNAENYKGVVDANGNPVQQVAGLSSQQQQAANLVGSNVGSTTAGFNTAAGTTATGAQNIANASTDYSNAGTTAAGALGQVNNATGSLGQATNTLNAASANLTPAAAALQQGTIAANPYTSNVTNTIQSLADQNLKENVLPAVNATFTGAGQFGGSRDATFNERAIRDNQQAISNAQGTALSAAQNTAEQNYLTQQGQMISGGSALGGLAQTGTNVAGGYTNVAGQQVNQGQAATQVGALQSSLGANQVAQGQAQVAAGQTQANQATQGQQANTNDVNSLLTTGGLTQTNQQQGLTDAYNAYLAQQQYPVTTLGALSSILPNIASKITPTTQTSTVNQNLPSDPLTNLSKLISSYNVSNTPTPAATT